MTNPIESLRESASNTNNDAEKKVFLYDLRKNDLVSWIDTLSDVIHYRDILKECNIFSTLAVERGVVRIDPSGNYVSHTLEPYVKAGFSFNELCILLRGQVVLFEEEYGKVHLTSSEIQSLKTTMYKFNHHKIMSNLDMSDKNKLIHIEGSSIVLYYILSSGVTLTLHDSYNYRCYLTFSGDSNSKKEYCTIFTESELLLLQKVNKAIQK